MAVGCRSPFGSPPAINVWQSVGMSNRWIVLLRGINVSGHNKVPMADLRAALSEHPFDNVSTYIQSGNVALDSSEQPELIAGIIEEELQRRFDVNVPVIVLDQSTIQPILDAAPFPPDAEAAHQLIYFADGTVDAAGISSLDADRYAADVITAAPNAVYVSYGAGQSKSKLSVDALERAAGCTLTGRNIGSTAKLIDL